MSNTLDEELIELASEINMLRQANQKRFPKAVWQKAVSIAEKLPLAHVCCAIQVAPAYLRKKIALFSPIASEGHMPFVELLPPKHEPLNPVTISIEIPCGNKLTIEGVASACLVPLVSEFLKGGSLCSK